MFFSLIKGINRSISNVKPLLKSYYWDKLTFSKLRFSKFDFDCLQVAFWRAPTHIDIIEF